MFIFLRQNAILERKDAKSSDGSPSLHDLQPKLALEATGNDGGK
jgi:hypothetical protein